MTMMMTDSQFGQGDMEALLWGHSSPMADPVGTLHPNSDPAEEPHGPEGPLSFFASSLPSSFSSPSASSSSASPPPFYSPPASPPPLLPHEDKAGLGPDILSLPWLAQSPRLGLMGTEVASGKGDAFGDLDWMTERMDLSEFDLESLIGSVDAPSSPEELLASLDGPQVLDALPDPPLPAPLSSPDPTVIAVPPPADVAISPASTPASVQADQWEATSPPPCVPEPQEELEIKSEPHSPAYTLDLGSEVDVVDCEVKECDPAPAMAAEPAAVVPQVPRIVLSLSPTRIVLLLTPKDPGTPTTTVTTIPVGHQSTPRPSTTSSRLPSRSRPYPDPSIQTPGTSGGGKVRSTRGSSGDAGGNSSSSSSSSGSSSSSRSSKAPKDKKLKKMEQNKTAATRYRQKKRVEQESLSVVYSDLERKNIELTEKADSMAREIQYLKELMEEVRTARLRKGLDADL